MRAAQRVASGRGEVFLRFCPCDALSVLNLVVPALCTKCAAEKRSSFAVVDEGQITCCEQLAASPAGALVGVSVPVFAVGGLGVLLSASNGAPEKKAAFGLVVCFRGAPDRFVRNHISIDNLQRHHPAFNVDNICPPWYVASNLWRMICPKSLLTCCLLSLIVVFSANADFRGGYHRGEG